MINKYQNLLDDDYYSILEGIMNEQPGSHLLSVPGVYEAVSEHFHNDIMILWEQEQNEQDQE